MPDAIGPYTIVREIGRGGMGIVYEGWDERLSRAVAIKTILRASDPAMRERFVREGARPPRSAIPTSASSSTSVSTTGAVLCMELLDGKSLAERLTEGPIPVPEAATTQLAVLSALAALHRRIVHRDLKPTNIFLSANGVKLLDFGLARGRSPASTRPP